MFDWLKRKLKGSPVPVTNEEWLEALSDPPDEVAMDHLLLKMSYGLSSVVWNKLDKDPEEFIKDIVQDAVLKVMDNLNTFRGDSKFTTWAVKIAIREAYTELRRKRYQDVSLSDITTDQFGSDTTSPDRVVHESMIVEKVMKIINEELSEKQKEVITAVMIKGIPVSVLAEKMDTNRNAIYKTVHDARTNIKNRLITEGIDPETVLNEL